MPCVVGKNKGGMTPAITHCGEAFTQADPTRPELAQTVPFFFKKKKVGGLPLSSPERPH